MQVRFTPEKEARLQAVAVRTGRNAEQVIEEAVDRLLEFESNFAIAVEKGRDSARRGELLNMTLSSKESSGCCVLETHPVDDRRGRRPHGNRRLHSF